MRSDSIFSSATSDARGEHVVDGVVYDGPVLRDLARYARGIVFQSQRSADLMRSAYSEIAIVPCMVVTRFMPEEAREPSSAGIATAPPRDANAGWLDDVMHRPARIAEYETGAAAYLTAVDHARSADALSRQVAAMLAADGLEARLASEASAAIADGVATHPASSRWMKTGE